MELPSRPEAPAPLHSVDECGDGLAALSCIKSSTRLRLTVAEALAEGRVSFHYQPVVRTDDRRFPAFYEMLARVTLRDGKVLPAGAFMPEVEHGPLGRALDRAALAAAVEALTRDRGLRVSINMSPPSMADPEWLARLEAAAARDPGATGRLILEITETAALESCRRTLDFMDRVRKLGCAFALDDFGAGATGFRHFRDFRFDMVKLDGAFVQGVSRSPDARALVECLRTLAAHFEMLTIAERVETEADFETLRRIGVDCLQGYLFGRPAAAPMRPEAPQRTALAG